LKQLGQIDQTLLTA